MEREPDHLGQNTLNLGIMLHLLAVFVVQEHAVERAISFTTVSSIDSDSFSLNV